MALGRLPDDPTDETQAVFSEINITPLTDIFLVLLIIFMVGASMAVQTAAGAGGESAGMQVDLPKGAAKDLAPGSSDVAVAILADGRVILGGEEVADDLLEAKLAEAQKQADSGTLIVQADEGVSHGRVVTVMEKARAAGFSRLAVATRGE
mgnify:CR=1 FL=1